VVSFSVLEQQEMGLTDYWDRLLRPMPPQCTGKPQTGKKTKKLSPLTLKNLTGAFVVFLIGLSLSLLAFLGEKIISLSEQHRSRKGSELQLQQDQKNCLKVSSTMTEEEEEPTIILK
jgi:ionotropic glutamate receptor